MTLRVILFSALALMAACSSGNQPQTNAEPAATHVDSIVLERTVCFGRCPAYRLRLSSDGHVLFVPDSPPGATSEGTIPTSDFQKLVSELERADFYAYPSVIRDDVALCAMPATDHPTSTITVFRDTEIKSVRDYTGCYAAPSDNRSEARLATLRKLDELVDSIAKSSRWVRTGTGR
jgi:hypothetical protein